MDVLFCSTNIIHRNCSVVMFYTYSILPGKQFLYSTIRNLWSAIQKTMYLESWLSEVNCNIGSTFKKFMILYRGYSILAILTMIL